MITFNLDCFHEDESLLGTAYKMIPFSLVEFNKIGFKCPECGKEVLLSIGLIENIEDANKLIYKIQALEWVLEKKNSDSVSQAPKLSSKHIPKIELSRISEVLKAAGGGLFTVGHYLIDDHTRLMYIILGGVVLYGVITAWLSGGII